ncbi:MAG: tetratricopeptide repeat protein [Calditrichia bacterium]
MRCKRYYLILLGLLIPICVLGQEYASKSDPAKPADLVNLPAEPISLRDSLILKSVYFQHHQEFDSTLETASKLITIFPHDPSGYFLTADAYQSFMREYRVAVYEQQFEQFIDTTLVIAKKAVVDTPDADMFFIYGAAEGYRALHLFRKGNWLKAIGASRSSQKYLKAALELNPDFVDPIFGFALFDYAKMKIRIFGVGLFGDKTSDIIVRLKKVMRESRFLRANAMYTLQTIYYETGELDSAAVYNDRICSNFPNSLVALYFRALILEKYDRLNEAKICWETIITKIESFRQPSNNYLAECHYHLSQIYSEMGDKKPAWQELRKAAHFIHRYKKDEELDGSLYTYKEIKKAIGEAFKKWEW